MVKCWQCILFGRKSFNSKPLVFSWAGYALAAFHVIEHLVLIMVKSAGSRIFMNLSGTISGDIRFYRQTSRATSLQLRFLNANDRCLRLMLLVAAGMRGEVLLTCHILRLFAILFGHFSIIICFVNFRSKPNRFNRSESSGWEWSFKRWM